MTHLKLLSPLLKAFLQLPLLLGKFAGAVCYTREQKNRSGPGWADNENAENCMVWLYSLATLVLAIPGVVVSSLMLIERGRKRRENHASKK